MELGVPVTDIGEIVHWRAASGSWDANGGEVVLAKTGFDHF